MSLQLLKSLGIVFLFSISTFAMADDPTRSSTVNGTGTAEVEPDRATIRMAIVARDAEVAAAQKAAADVSKRVLKMTDRLGIAGDDVDTTGASVRPDYRWDPEENRQELLGYVVERQMIVQIDDLQNLGAIVEGTVSAGVNQVSPPILDASRGKAISVNAGSNTPRPPMPQRAAMYNVAAGAAQAESYKRPPLVGLFKTVNVWPSAISEYPFR